MRFSINNFLVIMFCFGFKSLFSCCSGNAKGRKAESDFEKSCLAKHNYYRKLHGAPPLKLNATLSELSRRWAFWLARHKAFEHSDNGKYGENLWKGWGSSLDYTITGDKPIDSWYSENKYYKNYNQEPSTNTMSKSGHFTQLIWRESQQLGIGLVKRSEKTGVTYYVVCNYYPPGNYVGEFKKNVRASK